MKRDSQGLRDGKESDSRRGKSLPIIILNPFLKAVTLAFGTPLSSVGI
jgi:hypothetical protein